MEVPRITVDEVRRRIDLGEKVYFIDSRNDADWRASEVVLPGALRAREESVARYKDDFPGDALIVAYCT